MRVVPCRIGATPARSLRWSAVRSAGERGRLAGTFRGTFAPWYLLGAMALGFWLMLSPTVFGTSGLLADALTVSLLLLLGLVKFLLAHWQNDLE